MITARLQLPVNSFQTSDNMNVSAEQLSTEVLRGGYRRACADEHRSCPVALDEGFETRDQQAHLATEEPLVEVRLVENYERWTNADWSRQRLATIFARFRPFQSTMCTRGVSLASRAKVHLPPKHGMRHPREPVTQLSVKH